MKTMKTDQEPLKKHEKTPGKMKPNLEPWKTDLEQTFVTLTTIKTYVEPWQTNLEQWKDNENQPRTDKNHKNPLGTMKNEPRTLKNHKTDLDQ